MRFLIKARGPTRTTMQPVSLQVHRVQFKQQKQKLLMPYIILMLALRSACACTTARQAGAAPQHELQPAFSRCGTKAPTLEVQQHVQHLQQQHMQRRQQQQQQQHEQSAEFAAPSDWANPMSGVMQNHSSSSDRRASRRLLTSKAAAGQQRVYTIPTHAHVVVLEDAGMAFGNVSRDAVDRQVAALNTAYSHSAAQAGVRWVFMLVDVQYSSTPSDGDMCNPESEAKLKARLHRGSRDHLNLYITDLSACNVLGYATWPWDLGKKDGLDLDGVVVHFDTLPGSDNPQHNLGATAVHEVGHFLGLYHTFENGCAAPGDGVDDTPYCTAAVDEACQAHRDSCPQPGPDPIDKWMGYFHDSCLKSFTMGQQMRIEQMWKQYRQVAQAS